MTKRIDDAYEDVRRAAAQEIAVQILTAGAGSFFLELDGVKTRRGYCEPVLISWVDKAFERHTMVLGVGYDTGHGAANAALNVRERLADLDILVTIDEVERLHPGLPAIGHYKTMTAVFKAKYERVMPPQKAAYAALARYMFGSATADGAILKLLPKVVDIPEDAEDDGDDVAVADEDTIEEVDEEVTTTHHCSAHCVSLLSPYSFALKIPKSNRLPFRGEPQAQTIQLQIIELVKDLRSHYSDASAFNDLVKYAATLPPNEKGNAHHVYHMNEPTPTRFNSYADLILAMKMNMPVFSQLYDADAAANTTTTRTTSFSDEEENDEAPAGQHGAQSAYPCPEAVKAIFTRQTVTFVDDDGNAGTVSYMPYKEIGYISLVGRALVHLSNAAEAAHADAFSFECQLNRLLRQMQGQIPLEVEVAGEKKVVTLKTELFKTGLGSKVLPGLGRMIVSTASYYFDRRWSTDWGELLCIILHPFCSGQPSDKAKQWKSLKGRFTNMADPVQARKALMQAAETVLKQELEEQYDIDHGGDVAVDRGDTSGQEAEQEEQPAKRRYIGVQGLIDSDDEDGDAAHEPASGKTEEVSQQFLAWLTQTPGRLAKGATVMPTMIDYWRGQRDGMLRRVAQRAAAFTLSQCETERVNKLAKEVWSASRPNLLSTSVQRDVFLRYNLSRWPSIQYDWLSKKLKETK